MGTITCELEASYAATAGDDCKAEIEGKLGFQHEQRWLTFAVNGKGNGRRLRISGSRGAHLAGSSYTSSSFLHRRRASGSGGMQVFVRTLAGKSLALDVSPYDTVDEVKARIKAKERVAAAEQRLVFGGRELDDGRRTLAEYGVTKEANLYLQLRLRGGAGGDTGWPSCLTAVGVVTIVVALGAALAYFPALPSAAASTGGLTLTFLLFIWGLAVVGVNLITAGVCLAAGTSGESETLSREGVAQPALRKAAGAALARLSIAVLGPSGCGTATATKAAAVGLLVASVAVGTALNCFPAAGAGAADTGAERGLALLFLLWYLAVTGVNLITAAVCLITGSAETLSFTVQSVLRKASAHVRRNLGVVGVVAASSTATGVILSAAWPVQCFAWFGLFLVAMSLVTIGVANCVR